MLPEGGGSNVPRPNREVANSRLTVVSHLETAVFRVHCEQGEGKGRGGKGRTHSK